ncbi:Indoleacetamide hydrolase [Paraburkholderia ribeironis]|uniref:Indoleacetamide hydrolase n=1 Tax=Paraburkholderia ribeironis TaxID=1247936 RepID=A0A1N7S829_9BURK|nr:amidase family protein [Paraburkholderia ribeironis]SIT43546.1 Indoleacetamide hydrolase [Paraburkholderia ribeironis]
MHSENTLESLCGGIRTGAISAAEIRDRALSADAHLTNLNCFIRTRDLDAHFAKANDALKDAPLYGIPFSLKDNICVNGLPVTGGTPGMEGCIATRDALIVRKLKSLGAVVAGKNNMHELSFGITSVNPRWGTVGNPTAPGYLAGGSSGGCAAAVAAGIVPMAIGTDTGGSVRIPAAFCGITGFRPTSGHWSSAGIIPVSRTKDSPGLLTRTAKDALFLYDLLSPNSQLPVKQKSTRWRIGLPASMWNDLDDDVQKYCWHAVRRLTRAGFQCVELDDAVVADLNRSGTFTIPLYEFFMDFPRTLLSFGWGNRINAVFDNIRDNVVRNIIHANLGGQLISAADYSSAIQNIGVLRLQMNALFNTQQIDLLAYPTVPRSVPHLSDAERPGLFAEVIRNTDLASNAAMPSITLPVAPDDALPVGLSLDAARGQDRRLLALATSIEDILTS